MSNPAEPITLGLSREGHRKLKVLKEEGYFGEMTDAYRFAIALALAHGITGGPDVSRGTVFNVGTLDPDGSIYFAVKTFAQPEGEAVYKVVEKLAEWGVETMYRLYEDGTLSVSSLLKEAGELLAK